MRSSLKHQNEEEEISTWELILLTDMRDLDLPGDDPGKPSGKGSQVVLVTPHTEGGESVTSSYFITAWSPSVSSDRGSITNLCSAVWK